MFKIFKTADGKFMVKHTATSVVVGEYKSIRFATSVANLKNSKAAKNLVASGMV